MKIRHLILIEEENSNWRTGDKKWGEGGRLLHYQVSISGFHSTSVAGVTAGVSLPGSVSVVTVLVTRIDWQQEEAFLQASLPRSSRRLRPPEQAINPTTNKQTNKEYFMVLDFFFKINRCFLISRLSFVNYSKRLLGDKVTQMPEIFFGMAGGINYLFRERIRGLAH